VPSKRECLQASAATMSNTLKKPLYACLYLWKALRLAEIRRRERLSLLKTAILGWLWRRNGDRYVAFAHGGKVFLAGDCLNSDWNAFSDVFLQRPYVTDYTDALVIDIGAHKGYFGAFALLHGAARVVSLEPEKHNYSLLEQAAVSFRQLGRVWDLHKAAAASSSGISTLNVSGESWTHSLLPLPSQGKRSLVAQEQVRTLTIPRILQDSPRYDHRVIVKIDVEGAECDIIMTTPSETWEHVDEVYVEIHQFAPCRTDDIFHYFERAGFEVIPEKHSQVAHLRR
jgi:FkbM family methyltransferase